MSCHVLPLVELLVRKPWNPHTAVGCFSCEDLMSQNSQKDHCCQSPPRKLILRDASVEQLLPLVASFPRARGCSSPLALSKVLIVSEITIKLIN